MGFSVQTVNAIVKRPLVRCLKRCPSMQDTAQAKISMFSYEMVSKVCLTMEIPHEFNILMKYGPLKCMFELHFQIRTLPDIKLIFGH